MNSKLFALKIPENEKNAMDYISNTTNNTLSKIFYQPLQEAIYKDLGLILLYKIDLRNTIKTTELDKELIHSNQLTIRTLPIVEDFIGLMLEKNNRNSFWSLFDNITTNEKEFIFQDLNLDDIAYHLGKEYILKFGGFEEINLDLARNIFFSYMLENYFNITAVGSIQKLSHEWKNRNHQVKRFQDQIITKYMQRYQTKRVEAIKIDEVFEVSEYIE
jgi:hypothetical protein